ncbi:MAG: cell division topological specificity factor MinE [Chloroflexi bacterium]|nr:cell division topological specificity factor MinE [Ardenticatenaceae bacterium]MBL1129810.1 cell division topological specificity factor MinE [Chloroflexota bacterium]NOG35894.1 cell division topological specificity factor MinE [Chloroflexota bacterium]
MGKAMSWVDRLLGREEKSGATAKKRLQMVLIHDRSDVSPGVLAQIKDEIIQVFVKHLDINPEDVVVNVDQDERESRLVAEVPLMALHANGRR